MKNKNIVSFFPMEPYRALTEPLETGKMQQIGKKVAHGTHEEDHPGD